MSLGWMAGAAGVILAALALVAAFGGFDRPDPAREALQAFLKAPDGAAAKYPRLDDTLRARAWLLDAPEQLEGITLFIRMDDPTFAAERSITERDLRSALVVIAGKTWKAKQSVWTGGDGADVPLAQVRERLEAACPTPADAHMVLDLLVGQPAQEVTAIVSRLAGGNLPQAIRIRPFHGNRGTMLVDKGSPPYLEKARSYEGCLVRFEGPGWPADWRIGRLTAVGN